MNIRKAAGPDGITGRVLRSCADQLAGLFTSIFNESLATSVVPTSFKKSVIIPVPKNSKPSCLNDFRPLALTSTVMKVFERLLKKHICSSIPDTLDPLQFAYRPNRSSDDAISQVLHSSLPHSIVLTAKMATMCNIYSGRNSTLQVTRRGGQLKNQQPSKSPSSASAQKRAFSSCCGTKGMCGNASQRHSFISWLAKHPQKYMEINMYSFPHRLDVMILNMNYIRNVGWLSFVPSTA